jgi:citrate lyase gamma subunit
MNPTAKLLLRVAVAAVLTSALAHAVAAQQVRRNDRAREIRDREARAREDRELQVNLGMLEGASNRRAERQPTRQIYAQISEDFLQLQVVNSKLMQAVLDGGALDLTFVAKSASEIKKRAGRLKENLLLPEPEKGSKRPTVEVGAEAVQLRSSLSALGELIYGFVRNPVFKEANVADVQMLAKARRDLEVIIELSAQVKKSSEKLHKAERPSQ